MEETKPGDRRARSRCDSFSPSPHLPSKPLSIVPVNSQTRRSTLRPQLIHIIFNAWTTDIFLKEGQSYFCKLY